MVELDGCRWLCWRRRLYHLSPPTASFDLNSPLPVTNRVPPVMLTIFYSPDPVTGNPGITNLRTRSYVAIRCPAVFG